MTGGKRDYSEGIPQKVSRYNKNGWISPDLPSLNEGRWHHACGIFVDSNSNTVLKQHNYLGMHSKKKIAEKETLVHSHLTPSLPSLNGTREMGT